MKKTLGFLLGILTMLVFSTTAYAAGSTLTEGVDSGDYEEVYQNFLAATAFIADDTSWQNNVLVIYDLYAEAKINGYASWYESYVEGGTQEEFLSMSLYDRFVWVETYLSFAYYVNSGDFNKYYGSEDNFNTYAIGTFISMIEKISGYEPVEEAYLALVQWQYDYVMENGVPFNFINNRSYLDEVGSLPEDVTETETESEETTEDEEIAEAREELMSELSEEEIAELTEDTETTKEADSTSSGGTGMIVAIIVIVVVIGGGAFLFLRKKK